MVSIVAPIAILATISVVDRHHLDAYPDSYPTFHFYAYANPTPRFTRVVNKNFKKNYSQKCQVYALSFSSSCTVGSL